MVTPSVKVVNDRCDGYLAMLRHSCFSGDDLLKSKGCRLQDEANNQADFSEGSVNLVNAGR